MAANFTQLWLEFMSTRSPYCLTTKIQVDSLAGSPANNGGNSNLTFLAAKILAPKTPEPPYNAPPLAAVIATYAAEATSADAAVF